ncbi:hypothetical protein ZWY2020_037772 [Hordeum vulgare]|nr:hypothetical protein ZWY2020_037772 [Hordeum vulgare]
MALVVARTGRGGDGRNGDRSDEGRPDPLNLEEEEADTGHQQTVACRWSNGPRTGHGGGSTRHSCNSSGIAGYVTGRRGAADWARRADSGGCWHGEARGVPSMAAYERGIGPDLLALAPAWAWVHGE